MKRRVVVIGCGLMGSDIAAIFVAADWQVTAIEPDAASRDRSRVRVEASARVLRDDSIVHTADLEYRASLRDVDWSSVALVLECVPEDLSVKREVFKLLDSLVPVHIPIGSNSSGLPISVIAQACDSAERMANTHFFLPAHIIPLVELAKAQRTSARTMDELREIFLEVGRVPVVVNRDLPGFLANRLQHALMREAFAMLDAGLATPEDIDAAVRYGFGFRYVAAGPILQKELAGLDTQLAAAQAIYPTLSNNTAPSKVLVDKVRAGHVGARTLRGFWEWTDDALTQKRRNYEQVLLAAAKLLRQSEEAA